MTIREKLINILRVPIYPHLDADPAEVVADYLLDNGVTVQQWIPVTERLPEEDTRVLVYLNIEKTDAQIYTFFDTDRLLHGKWVRWNTYISHWMPLPEPPKEVG